MRQGSKLLLLVVLVCLPLACQQSGEGPVIFLGNQPLDFADVLPEDWQHIGTYRLDVNDDDRPEWVVLYRFDLLPGRNQRGSPIAAAVYQPDGRKPPHLRAYELHLPDGDYLCECSCKPLLKDILSGLDGPELIVRDQCDGKDTRLSIFHWSPTEGQYLSYGHFLGSDIKFDTDEVMVDQPWPGRAQLAMQETYHPAENNSTYFQPGGQGLHVNWAKRELVFAYEEPRDVKPSPYPEKIVLAFYIHYPERGAQEFFTTEGWQRVAECTSNRCGCASARDEIEHVWVTDLRPEAAGSESDRASVVARVTCERRDKTLDPETSIRWHLVRQGDRWHLDSAE